MDNVNYCNQELQEVAVHNSNDEVPVYEKLDHTSVKRESVLLQRKQGSSKCTCNSFVLPLQIALQCIALMLLSAILASVAYLLQANVKPSTDMSADVKKNVMDVLNDLSNEKFDTVADFLSSINVTSASTAEAVDDVLLLAKQLVTLHIRNDDSSNDSLDDTDNPSFATCHRIRERLPNIKSGYYNISGRSTYCNMGVLCGSEKGWTRLAYLDMSDLAQACPSGLSIQQSGGIRACGRPVTDSSSCASVQFPSNGIRYSRICGRVVGYQWGTPGGLHNMVHNSAGIDSCYVDGISITRGSPREHVWTLAAGNSEVRSIHHVYYNCPCNNVGGFQLPQTFIGNHYHCESANINIFANYSLYTSDPLWDGQGCGPNEIPCCSAPGIPWFHRDYGNTTSTDYIELRVCGGWSTSIEDTPISFYEIYVQ